MYCNSNSFWCEIELDTDSNYIDNKVSISIVKIGQDVYDFFPLIKCNYLECLLWQNALSPQRAVDIMFKCFIIFYDFIFWQTRKIYQKVFLTIITKVNAIGIFKTN